MAAVIPVEDPWFKVIVNNQDVSQISTSLTYTDYLHGQSDTLEIELEDREHHWKDDWFPVLGSVVTAQIGYTDGRVLDCGAFQLDEVEWNVDYDSGDRIRIRAITTIITPRLRTAQTIKYEGMNLKQIVEAVAARNNLTVRGEIEEIPIDYTAQNHLTDLNWLVQLAEDHGYVTGIRYQYLDFWKATQLEEKKEVMTFKRHEVKSFSIQMKTEATFPDGETYYQDPDAKGLVKGEAAQSSPPTGDTIKYIKRSKTKPLADLKARSHLHRVDKVQLTGSLIVVGNTDLIAGVNIGFTHNYKLDGKYHIDVATHRMDRRLGYETTLDLHRVEPWPPTPPVFRIGYIG